MKTVIGIFIISSLLLGCSTTSMDPSGTTKQEVVLVKYLVGDEIQSAGSSDDYKCYISWGNNWSVISIETDTTIENVHVKTEDIISYGTREMK